MLDADTGLRSARIEIRGLEKRFGDNLVLSRLDLTVRSGEFVSIVGKSGCGKSTLLRLIAGLDQPSAGRVAIDGAPPADSAGAVRIMFQEPRLLPWATVVENVRVGLSGGQGGGAGAEHRALDEVQLPDKAGDWPALLSGGQKQRVALARALVSRPRLLLLDEPLGALDALTRLVMQELILSVKREAGFTALLVTHDVAEAVAMSDRVIVLDAGRVAEDVRIDEPHPRRRAAALAEHEERILDAIFGRTPAQSAPRREVVKSFRSG